MTSETPPTPGNSDVTVMGGGRAGTFTVVPRTVAVALGLGTCVTVMSETPPTPGYSDVTGMDGEGGAGTFTVV